MSTAAGGGGGTTQSTRVSTVKPRGTGLGEPVAGGQLRQEIRAFEIHRDDLVEDVFGRFGDIGADARRDAGVVD